MAMRLARDIGEADLALPDAVCPINVSMRLLAIAFLVLLAALKFCGGARRGSPARSCGERVTPKALGRFPNVATMITKGGKIEGHLPYRKPIRHDRRRAPTRPRRTGDDEDHHQVGKPPCGAERGLATTPARGSFTLTLIQSMLNE
jgi:hypothetical protein